MKITQKESKRYDWDKCRSWNYKLKHLSPYQSVIYAELDSDHGQVSTSGVERVYYIIDGQGDFIYDGQIFSVQKGDVFTVPPKTVFNYHPTNNTTLKVVLFMELWDN